MSVVLFFIFRFGMLKGVGSSKGHVLLCLLVLEIIKLHISAHFYAHVCVTAGSKTRKFVWHSSPIGSTLCAPLAMLMQEAT